MNKSFFIISFFLISLIACKNKDEAEEGAEDNVNTARNFIRAALDGKFNDARNYLLADSVNINYMDVVERAYKNIDQSTKDGYRSSSIRIIAVNPVNDSVTIMIYSNSFKNNPDTLKVLKINNKWLVDLKYLYLHDQDTSKPNPVIIDSLP